MSIKKKPYVPGLICCFLVIINKLVTIFGSSDDFNINYIIYFLAVLLSAIYCFKSNRKLVLMSYFLNLTNIVISNLIICINIIKGSGDFYYLSMQDRQAMILKTLSANAIFSMLPLIFLITALFINKKRYRIFITSILILTYGYSIISSLYIAFHIQAPYTLLESVNNITSSLYIMSIWYKVALSEYFVYKHPETADPVLVEKEFVSVEFSLEKLKKSFDSGEISEAEYNTQKAKIMSNL